MLKMIRACTAFLGFLVAIVGLAQESPQRPPPGPAAQPGKTVAFVASDYRNGGVMGAYRAFEEAAHKLRWQVRLEDGQGRKSVQAAVLARVIAANPDGIVFGGFDPVEFAGEVAEAKRRKIVLVGWHAAANPGQSSELFFNVSTRPVDVAQIAVDYVLQHARVRKTPVGVVIFNDNQYAVANTKTDALKKGIEACRDYIGCRVLSVENVAISDAATAIPSVVSRLAATFGTAWTYSLAINDVYFDEINFPLVANRRTDIVNVSAGDGSSKAIGRIGAGVSQQAATVAEPIRVQGYQLADELNRAFAGVPPSGFQSKPILITAKSVNSGNIDGGSMTPEIVAAYKSIWSKP